MTDGTASPDGPGRPAPERGRTGWRRLVPTWKRALTAAVIALALLAGGVAYAYHSVRIPEPHAAASAQSNVYLYADGTELARAGKVDRENVPLSRIPLTVRRAVLAAEDRDFYAQPAVDPAAMLRAGWNTATGKGTQGGSTIVQQYVKNAYLSQDRTLSRKARELLLAVKLGRQESKDEILEGYLNTSYFGRGAYGIQSAARAYFGKDVRALDTAQGAYLATLLNAPSRYDVVAEPQNKPRAEGRWRYVLAGMDAQGWLSTAARKHTAFPDIEPAAETSPGLSGRRGYLVEAVDDYLLKHHVLTEDQLSAGGYRITTTIRRDRQDALDASVRTQLTGKLRKGRKADANVRAGAVSADPATGDVVALYGGSDYTRHYTNNATRRDHQVGSTFKPFVLAAALQDGATTADGQPITPRTVYDGTSGREVVQDGTGTGYRPRNEDGVSYGPIDVTRATDSSVNSVYAQMAADAGPAEVERTAVALGLPAGTPDLHARPSIALGPASASVLDMTQAYDTLAAHGERTDLRLVTSLSRQGEQVALPERRRKRAVSREAADTTTAVLQSVVANGSGTAARAAGRPAAGKTGTGEDDKSAWFAGYTPDSVTVVALFGQHPTTAAQTTLHGVTGLPRIDGGGYPARIWADYTGRALRGSPPSGFALGPPRRVVAPSP